MSETHAQFILYADLQMSDAGLYGWRFVLEALDGSVALEESDVEPGLVGERLELLAVIRGLESLEQPSEVFLLTPSRYVIRGIRYGLPAWRDSGWCWERFGCMVPVKNADLWERVDRALTYHRIHCRRASMRMLSEATAPAQSGQVALAAG